MHHLRLNIRAVALVAFLAAVAFLFVSPGRDAAAEATFEFEGVVCIEVAQGPIPRATLILARIEPSNTNPTGWDLTLKAYEGDTDGDTIADTNAGPPCNPATDDNSLTPGVEFEPGDVGTGPSAVAKVVVDKYLPKRIEDPGPNEGPCNDNDDNGGDTVADDADPDCRGRSLDWEGDCTFRDDINQWVLARFNVDIQDVKTLTKDTGTLNVWLDPNGCPDSPPPPDPTLSLNLSSHVRDVPPKGSPDPLLADDWDGDGCSDWEELHPTAPRGADPFNPTDCPVGGIVELADVDSTALEAGSSGSNVGLIAAVTAAATAGALALGGMAWYARRRWVR